MILSEITTNRVWKDLDMNFTKHPMTGDISTLLDSESVKRSLKNLIMTRFGERPFQPWIGSGINDLIFEHLDGMTISSLKSEIRLLIRNFEPRVSINNIIITSTDFNEFRVRLEFILVNYPVNQIFILDTLLQRIK